MDPENSINASEELLDDIRKQMIEEERENSINKERENCTIEDTKVKPGYRYYMSTIRKLEYLQSDIYPRNKNGTKTSMETIIDDAINYWYELKKNEGK